MARRDGPSASLDRGRDWQRNSSCERHVRNAFPKSTPSDPGDRRSCRTAEEKLRKVCVPEWTGVAHAVPNFDHMWPPNRSKVGKRSRPSLAEIGQVSAKFGTTWPRIDPTWPNLAGVGPKLGSRGNSSTTFAQLFRNIVWPPGSPGVTFRERMASNCSTTFVSLPISASPRTPSSHCYGIAGAVRPKIS